MATRPAKAPTAIAAELGQAAERVSLSGANIPRTPGGGGKSISRGPDDQVEGPREAGDDHAERQQQRRAAQPQVEPEGAEPEGDLIGKHRVVATGLQHREADEEGDRPKQLLAVDQAEQGGAAAPAEGGEAEHQRVQPGEEADHVAVCRREPEPLEAEQDEPGGNPAIGIVGVDTVQGGAGVVAQAGWDDDAVAEDGRGEVLGRPPRRSVRRSRSRRSSWCGRRAGR